MGNSYSSYSNYLAERNAIELCKLKGLEYRTCKDLDVVRSFLNLCLAISGQIDEECFFILFMLNPNNSHTDDRFGKACLILHSKLFGKIFPDTVINKNRSKLFICEFKKNMKTKDIKYHLLLDFEQNKGKIIHSDFFPDSMNIVNISNLDKHSGRNQVYISKSCGYHLKLLELYQNKDRVVLSIQIEIKNQFWLSQWGLTIYIAIIFLVFYFSWKKVQKIKSDFENAKHSLSNKIRKKISSDFHDELGPKATKISLIAELLKKNNIHVQQHELLEKLIDQSKKLTRGFRDFIWLMEPSHDSLEDLINRIKDYGERLLDHSGIYFHSYISGDKFYEYHLGVEERQQVLLVMQEAVHNSLKHSKAKDIFFKAYEYKSFLYLELKDNGKGIEAPVRSDGIGVKSMKNRAEKIGGTLFIRSDDNGTVVNLKIMLKQAGSAEQEASVFNFFSKGLV